MKTIVILGSAREESQTLKAVKALCPFPEYEVIDLQKLKVEHYRYNQTSDDDFLKIAQKMQTAENIVFATPVYWYSMSGRMKVFFDRLTDLLFTHKAIGKNLKGKKTFLIASGSDPELPLGFEIPFKLSSEYFEMSFEKSFYLPTK